MKYATIPFLLGVLAVLALYGREAKPAPAAPTDEVHLSLQAGGRAHRLLVSVRAGKKTVRELREEYFHKLFALLDRDDDGSLSKQEAGRAPTPIAVRQQLWGYFQTAAAQAPAFSKLDGDRDGMVSRAEFARFYQEAGLGGPLVALGTSRADSALDKAMMRWLDTDKDGKLSRKEWAAAGRIVPLDANGDELLSADELVAGLTTPYLFATRLLNGTSSRDLSVCVLGAAKEKPDFAVRISLDADL